MNNMQLRNITPHGRGVRGLNLSRSSIFFGGAFGRIFRALPAAEFGASDDETLANLKVLGKAMVSTQDLPKDGPDAEESGIPSLYTYLGQFVDHDLTFDPASSLQQQNDPDGLVDYRTPKFDLDNVYGRGPDDQPYLYDFSEGSDKAKFLMGKTLTGAPAILPPALDLARNGADPQRAIIGDPRNDENTLVSQLQGLFLRFHNRLITDKKLNFADAQKTLRFHYQWMLIHDFLVKLINQETLHTVFPHLASGKSIADDRPEMDYYHARNEAFMPLEFSVAAYRFGHSMVRPGYRLNDNARNLLPIFPLDENQGQQPHSSLRGFTAPADDWAIDWARFIDIENRPNGVTLDDDGKINGENPTAEQLAENRSRLQMAYRIDTSIVFPLGRLPVNVADKLIRSLAERNLVRGWRLRLPNGQAVAKAMGIVPVNEILIGKFEDEVDAFNLNDLKDKDDKNRPVKAFVDNCPLWTYCLAETKDSTVPGLFGIKTKQLGPVGGRIVAETFAGLLTGDSQSFVGQDPRWTPTIGDGKTFGLREFVKFAIGK
jgi:Animal haem peroxidase